MSAEPAGPAVRRTEEVAAGAFGPGVTVAEMLNDEHGCRGLHQRRLRFAGGAGATGTAGGRGEAWYVISGAAEMDLVGGGRVALERGTAVWMPAGVGYECVAQPGPDLEILAVEVRAGSAAGPRARVVRLADCAVERTGDREFRVLLSEGLVITQFAGLIPPGRAPAHHHTYDEVVHVLAGRGVVHLSDTETEIGPGTSIYLPPYQPHCLENTGREPLRVLGVFYPAGSPAAKQAS